FQVSFTLTPEETGDNRSLEDLRDDINLELARRGAPISVEVVDERLVFVGGADVTAFTVKASATATSVESVTLEDGTVLSTDPQDHVTAGALGFAGETEAKAGEGGLVAAA